MILTHIDLKYVSLIYRKIHQKLPNGKGLRIHFVTLPYIEWDIEVNDSWYVCFWVQSMRQQFFHEIIDVDFTVLQADCETLFILSFLLQFSSSAKAKQTLATSRSPWGDYTHRAPVK